MRAYVIHMFAELMFASQAVTRYETLYNRILDVTACFNIPLKSFAIYVIIRHTPPQLRHHSFFIINTMLWNFLANFVFAGMHLYPLFPAICLRVDGISSHFIDSEVYGQFMFILMFFLITECGIALVFAYPHRYIVFAHPKLAVRIRPARVFRMCAAIHVIFALFYFPLVIAWTISYDKYPNKAELPERPFVFCFYPNGIRKIGNLVAYVMLIATGSFVIVASSFLFLLKVKRLEKRIIHDDTHALQKKVFLSLLMLTAIALFFGAIPILAFICAASFPYTPYANEATLVFIVVLCNHGTVSAIAYLVSFKSYRDAVKRMISNQIAKLTERKSKVHSFEIAS